MGVFDRIFGQGGYVQAARRAELRGELARAAELWGLAGQPEETARIMILRGDAEVDPVARRQHYLQAKLTAPEGHPTRDDARKKHALLTVSMAKDGAVSAAFRQELVLAARELEELGEPMRAADGYRLAGDEEGQARALTQAGEIEKLETLLAHEHDRDRRERERRQTVAEIEMMVAGGRRREALAAGQSWLAKDPEARMLRDLCDTLLARRTKGSTLRAMLEGRPLLITFGKELVLGRTEGEIQIASHAVSRRHLRIFRERGETFAADLGSRNGTYLRGLPAAGMLAVGDGLELVLGNEVHLHLSPSRDIEGALAIEAAGRTYLAPFGPAKLPIGDWRLELTDTGWVELVANAPAAFIGGVALGARSTLLAGDRIASARGGPSVLEIAGAP